MISIIIPTYNEKENLPEIVDRIFGGLHKNELDGEVVIVDDDSPDGTGKVAEELKKRYNLQVLIRKNKRGLASAVVDGFKMARGDILGVMDADLSHPPELIPMMVKPLLQGDADLVIGSRYVEGGGIKDWPLKRRTLSIGAILLSRPLTNVHDSVSGFFFFKKQVINGVQLNPKGYKIGLEILVKGRYKKVKEAPFVFPNREKGDSKLGWRECWDYLVHLFSLYKYKLMRTS